MREISNLGWPETPFGAGQRPLGRPPLLLTAVSVFAPPATRHHTMIISDKTIANVLAYARLVLPTPAEGRQEATLAAMETFCQAWADTYDAVFYCCDRFGQQQPGDPYRAKVLDIQPAVDRIVRHTCAATGQRVIDIPPGMATGDRVRWVAARVSALGLLPPGLTIPGDLAG